MAESFYLDGESDSRTVVASLRLFQKCLVLPAQNAPTTISEVRGDWLQVGLAAFC